MADIAASVLAKLRNKAKASGISYQQCLQLFVQEEFLRKLSKSGCEDTLILKGGLFIYTLTNFESRATIDVDFLLRGYSNTIDDVKELICKIIDTPTGNDYIEMRAKGFEEISPQRKYHGISTQIIAQIKNVRVPFNVDIGVGDIIVPRAEERTINTQLPDFEAPVIKTYSLESTIAEKFDAILQRFELTGRMKDFYDIYYLSRTFDFEGAKLQAAIFETLQRRGTPYDRDSFKRVVALADDEDMISQEYYSDLIQLNTLKAQLKQKYKKQKANEKSTAYIKENLSPLLTDYFALLEQDFDGKISVQKMLKIASDLPEFDDTQLFGENKIAERYSELNAVLENLRNEEREILLKIKNIDNAFDTGSSFTQMLKDLKQQTSIAEIETDEYTCPLCGHECKEIAENDSKLIEATEWLDNELRITEKYTSDFSEDVRKLKEAHSKIDEKIRDVWKQIKTIEEKFISSKALVSKREKVNYAKARIALYAEMSSSGIFETVDGDIEELKEKIARLEEKIKGFDVDKKMSKAESFLSNNMNRLSLTLDFEEEYRPIDLNFGLTDGSFDIYQHQKSNENIHLYEMGSGANWVSCHIALFLS